MDLSVVLRDVVYTGWRVRSLTAVVVVKNATQAEEAPHGTS
jgi:hypothetical protein